MMTPKAKETHIPFSIRAVSTVRQFRLCFTTISQPLMRVENGFEGVSGVDNAF